MLPKILQEHEKRHRRKRRKEPLVLKGKIRVIRAPIALLDERLERPPKEPAREPRWVREFRIASTLPDANKERFWPKPPSHHKPKNPR